MPNHLKSFAKRAQPVLFLEEVDLCREAQEVLTSWQTVERVRDLTVELESSTTLTRNTIDAYRRNVSLALVPTDLESPELNGLPSFESSADYSVEAEEKKAGILKRAWAWIVRMFKALGQMIKNLFTRSKAHKEQDKARNEKMKDKADDTFKKEASATETPEPPKRQFKAPDATLKVPESALKNLVNGQRAIVKPGEWLKETARTSTASMFELKKVCETTLAQASQVTEAKVDYHRMNVGDQMVKAIGLHQGKKLFPINGNLRVILSQGGSYKDYHIKSELDYLAAPTVDTLPTLDAHEIYAYLADAKAFNDQIDAVFAPLEKLNQSLGEWSGKIESSMQKLSQNLETLKKTGGASPDLEENAGVYHLLSGAVYDMTKAMPAFVGGVWGVKNACDVYVNASIDAHRHTA